MIRLGQISPRQLKNEQNNPLPPASHSLCGPKMKPNAATVARTSIERKFLVKDKTRLRKRRSERWHSVSSRSLMAAWDKKEKLEMKAWLKDVAPSPALRKWFAHDPAKWEEFQKRYRAELESNPDAWKPILEAAKQGDVTLLYSARDTEHNSALLLKVFLEEYMNVE